MTISNILNKTLSNFKKIASVPILILLNHSQSQKLPVFLNLQRSYSELIIVNLQISS